MQSYYADEKITIYNGDNREILPTLPEKSVHCCVTSPPYFGLRDYGNDAQIGLEKTPDEYVAELVKVFREVRRVLRDDGTLWLNLGDSYTGAGNSGGANKNDGGAMYRGKGLPNKTGEGLKPKDLIGIPWRVAFALQADGWYLRQDIIWAKPNPMPESVTDRCTKAHEYIFLLSKSARYYFDSKAIAESTSANTTWTYAQPDKAARAGNTTNGTGKSTLRAKPDIDSRNRRSVWTVATQPYSGAHFATFPPELIKPCIMAGCPEGGTVLDPFAGSGTTLEVAELNGCKAIGVELNPSYCKLIKQRVRYKPLAFAE